MAEPGDSGPRPLVWFIPEKRGRMVTMHACWGADFMGVTAVFPTMDEAVAFCHKRWKREPRVDLSGSDESEFPQEHNVVDITRGEWGGCPHEHNGSGKCRWCDAAYNPAEVARLTAEIERIEAEHSGSPVGEDDHG